MISDLATPRERDAHTLQRIETTPDRGIIMQKSFLKTPVSFRVSEELDVLLRNRAKTEGVGYTKLIRQILIEKLLTPGQQQTAQVF